MIEDSRKKTTRKGGKLKKFTEGTGKRNRISMDDRKEGEPQRILIGEKAKDGRSYILNGLREGGRRRVGTATAQIHVLKSFNGPGQQKGGGG